MKKKLLIYFLFSFAALKAQNKVTWIIKDSVTKEILPGVSIILDATTNGTSTDINGKGTLFQIPDGENTVHFNFIGYKNIKHTYLFPLIDTAETLLILLPEQNENLEEVIISSTRTNSRIEDLNTKVEVLGQDDMDEESTVVPGSVTSILGDLSIITIQRTNPVNGNEAIRMQGLDPRYTQIMRDGLPLYGGFSGSLGVLSIPPLDLKQVEIIKGSASTLYGGGAIGGLINFISKAPVDSAKTTITLNASSLKEYNLNAFTSKKNEKLGLTLFAGVNIKTPYDVNGDGFAEVPEHKNVTLHPRVFYNFNKNSSLVIGLTSSYDTRMGGDMKAILYKTDSIHTFLQKEKTFRNTLDVAFSSALNERHLLTFKTAGSAFQRSIDYSGFIFNGTQYSTYSELNDFIKLKRHSIVIGTNLTSEIFLNDGSDSVLFHNYEYQTNGFFIQDDWQLTSKFSIQGGFRFDHHNKFGNFYLPRLSLFYKASSNWSVRLVGGTGYKVPNLFDFYSPSNNLLDIQSSVKPENSYGLNSDINYHTVLFEKLSVQVNEALYYTHIDNPVMTNYNSIGQKILQNGNYVVNSYGTDTYIRLSYHSFELYLGYNHTESLQETTTTYLNMPFNPKDKCSTTLAYEIEGKWRMGIEASWMGNQYIYNNQKVNNFWFLAAMVERKFRKGSVVLNCENLLDTRQSKYEPIVTGTTSSPVFKSVWAPLEGRVINLSIKLSI
ncbi:MAG: TonB-dependent receptor [Burkholderiales bacterium]|nr:TonB-dependent receptor [Bacteroidia bacterium]